MKSILFFYLILIIHHQVHADASNFDQGVTKDEAYEQVLLQAEGLFTDQRNWVSKSFVLKPLSK